MPQVIELADDAAMGAEDLAEALGATGFHPEDPENLAHAARLAGRDEDERSALDRALALDQTDFGAQLRKAQLLQRLGLGLGLGQVHRDPEGLNRSWS